MILTDTCPSKKQQQGEQSRALILDATERLMATRGYAATSISDIRTACGQLAVLSRLQLRHPLVLRLFYMLSLERSDDPAVAGVVRRVRDTAIRRFRVAITGLLPADAPPAKAERVVTELTALAIALSDGVFFAE